MSRHLRTTAVAIAAVLVTVLSAAATDRLILKLALEHQSLSPQLSLAAAMGGLFAGGLIAVLAILIAVRSSGGTH